MNFLKKRNFTYGLYAQLSRLLTCIYPAILFSLLVVFFVLAGLLVNDAEFKEFGINFLAEMVGIFVMVYVVEHLYTGMRKQRGLPIRIVILRDLTKIFDRYYLLWKAAYEHVGIDSVLYVETVYNQKLYKRMMLKLDLNDIPEGHLRLRWDQLISRTCKDIEEELKEFIAIHYSRMDAKLLSSLFQFLDSDFFGSSLELSRLRDLRGQEVSTYYAISLKPSEAYFELILDIHYWIIREKERLNRSSEKKLLATTFSSEFEEPIKAS